MKVRNLARSVRYVLQDYKTQEHLVTTHECSEETIENDFKDLLYLYNEKNNTNKGISARMIIQSFDPDEDITPEQAHHYGVEYAKNYLENKHQYMVVTHVETDHIHNHIIFNDINTETLKKFESKRSNTLHRLRHENDKISEKYGLNIIEKTSEKSKYLSFNEYVARSKGISFKEKMENDIDSCIMAANTFDDFLQIMEKKGYEYKEGKYLSFKHPSAKKFTRTKMLGMNYLESSIKYRIDHKDYIPIKPKIINREWIDKTQEKFKENKGLRKWATIQNINYLNDINSLLYKENISLEQYQAVEMKQKNLVDSFERSLNKIDDEIFKLEKMSNSFQVYRRSYSMMVEYKKLNAQEKDAFKKENYTKFKRYDQAKKDLNILKKVYNIDNEDSLRTKILDLKEERDLLYSSLNMNKPELNIDKEGKLVAEEKRKKDTQRDIDR